MRMKTPYKVKCAECGTVNLIDMDLECVSSYERKMGLELEHLAAYDGTCHECGKDFYVFVAAWEYPEGTIESYSVKMESAEKIEEPSFIEEL